MGSAEVVEGDGFADDGGSGVGGCTYKGLHEGLVGV